MPFHARFALFIVALLLPSAVAFGGDPDTVFVPTGGNAWLVVAGDPAAAITDAGLAGWKDSATVCRFFLRFSAPATFRCWLRVAPTDTGTVLRVRGPGGSVAVWRSGGYVPGAWHADSAGYVAIDVQGAFRADSTFGILEGLIVATDVPVEIVPNNDGNFFYWGRRGPSVHLNYDLPESVRASWFYNEVTVPPGGDVIGSFFMANGFSVGYFGIQVNDTSERRVLFSVWSPFTTDDPAAIPPADRVLLRRRGPEVRAGEFGSEGSGGQSYLVYPWKAGTTYRFLLHAQPDTAGGVGFTAWFYPPEEARWRLIASFRRPRTTGYLARPHSFLENFIPETGITTRTGTYGNAWVRETSGRWRELTRARFTADNTARKGYRRDYAGGVEGTRFFLRNCGFFAAFTPIGNWLERPALGVPPAIDEGALP